MINTSKNTGNFPTAQIAGIMPNDPNIEFMAVRMSMQVLWLQNGRANYFSDLPMQYFLLLKAAYLRDHNAQQFLNDVTDEPTRRIELYTYYMYGELNGTPDIIDGQLAASENFRHSINCPSLLWETKTMRIGDHTLTPRQLTIIDLIGKDYPNKTIADKLGIALSTYDFHATNLFNAVGVTNKTALLQKAYQHKILN